ncbi:hypothetical protein GEV33_014435 [Tenebrio molitor]|uniref:Uncharacterized protein n=2 Tax=Tenebrio molitor TaxID=7067 RepID=A0A8J6GYB0_TENMO|nr:hypothetical protein GEV33_014435 [Tenebrio molitor]
MGKVKETVSRLTTDHRDLHSTVSKVGKAIDRNFVADFAATSREDVFASSEKINLINKVICQHLYRQGMQDVADALVSDADISPEVHNKEPFTELNHILDSLKNKDLEPALAWATAHHDSLEAQNSSLEFKLHRLKFIELLKQGASHQTDAISYARIHFRKFVLRHEKDIQTLMGMLLYVPNGIGSSPYSCLLDSEMWIEIYELFTHDACQLLGVSVNSPLGTCINAGCAAIPALLNIKQVMMQRQVTGIWNGKDELPIEIDLGNDGRYHSMFACPILRQQSTQNNPPMRLNCGHVISRDALNKLCNGNKHFCTMVVAPLVTLNNGHKCPQLGLGTWLSAPGEVQNAIKHAIDVGYRHIDCAMLYGNEKEIGEAIREKIADGTVKREELFVVTKLWNTFHETEKVAPTCKKSLENFGLDYLDLYLIHWPVAQRIKGELNINLPFKDAVGIDYDYVDTWKGMEECVRLGLTKSIGLSNFNSAQVQRVLDNATIKPAMNQIEVTPNLNQKKLIKFCTDRGVHITAYSPFGSPARPWAKPGDPVLKLDDPKLITIGEKYNKSSSQVILRYLIQLGTIPIPKSSNPKRIELNLDVFDFNLNEEDMAVVDSFNCNGRAVSADELKGLPHYPFEGVEF